MLEVSQLKHVCEQVLVNQLKENISPNHLRLGDEHHMFFLTPTSEFVIHSELSFRHELKVSYAKLRLVSPQEAQRDVRTWVSDWAEEITEAYEVWLRETPLFARVSDNLKARLSNAEDEIIRLKARVAALEPYETHFRLEMTLRHGDKT